MSSNYFVVDHASDERKKDGIVESYQMVPFQYEQEGQLLTGMKRLNFVHWPELPHPFVHEEWNEDLIFSNIYIPELDAGGDGDNDDDEEEEEELPTEPVGEVDQDGLDDEGNEWTRDEDGNWVLILGEEEEDEQQ